MSLVINHLQLNKIIVDNLLTILYAILMNTLITKLDQSTHKRLESMTFEGVLLRNDKDVRDAIKARWGVEVTKYLPRSFRGGNFIFNVFLTK